MSPADKRQMVKELCSALEQDSRVVEVMMPDLNPEFTVRRTFYPDLNRTNKDNLLTGSDAFPVLDLSDPIRFHVHVPKKNQPQPYGWDDIPAEDYWVAWDGVVAVVLWEQDEDHVPLAGGHVVVDILASALASTKAELYVQACSPECKNVFFHMPLHVELVDDHISIDDSWVVPRDDRNGANVTIPRGASNFDTLMWLYLSLDSAASYFGRMKNVGRRVIDVESLIRDEMAHLLGHYYEHAVIASKPWWRSLKERWLARGWRREAREILAGLWLSLANVESLRRDWGKARQRFESDRDRSMALFAIDHPNDVALIDSMEVSHLDATIEQISGNLNNRAVVMATMVGALAGGLAGALVGLIH